MIPEKYLNIQAPICEISQMEQSRVMWELPYMSKKKDLAGIGAEIIDRLERARPIIEQTGKPISDNRWCELAGVNTGYWRDLRNGTEPGVNKIERLARVAKVPLARLVESAEAGDDEGVPSGERLFEVLAGLIQGQGIEQAQAGELADALAQQLPGALDRRHDDRFAQPGRDAVIVLDVGHLGIEDRLARFAGEPLSPHSQPRRSRSHLLVAVQHPLRAVAHELLAQATDRHLVLGRLDAD